MSYTITNDDWKPSLLDEDELAHYGIKGMKWGVRRSDEELARARGKRQEYRKPSAFKTKTENKRIKKARARVLAKRDKEAQNADSLRAKASIAFLGDFSKHLSVKYRADPDRRIAFQSTNGEKVANILLSVPTLGASALVSDIVNNSLNASIRADQGRASVEAMSSKDWATYSSRLSKSGTSSEYESIRKDFEKSKMDVEMEKLLNYEKMSDAEFNDVMKKAGYEV